MGKSFADIVDRNIQDLNTYSDALSSITEIIIGMGQLCIRFTIDFLRCIHYKWIVFAVWLNLVVVTLDKKPISALF